MLNGGDEFVHENQTDVDPILGAAQVLLEPGQVGELRILNTARGIVSGYFDNIHKLVAAARRWNGKAEGVYVTLNPVTSSLLARACNRLVEYAKHTASDLHIVRRRWIPIDFDPVRAAGISSTDAEHEAAITRARACIAELRALGFTALLFADSGNGAHVLVAIDLPNDEESTVLVKRCIEAVALRFSDEKASVDLGIYNAARIWKLYGTLACKGDSIPERPHRLARLMEVPELLNPEPRELLEKLAALAPEEPKAEHGARSGTFDLDYWLMEHQLDAIGPHQWGGGKKWVFPTYPWNTEHTNRAAYIIQHASGAIAAGCHHNGCRGKDWHALRDLIEPRWREHRRASGAAFEEPRNPWLFAKSAPTFLAEEEKEFHGLAKDILAPGAITAIASPRGLGKTQFSHALAVALGSVHGQFRGETVQPCRVLLLDRDNPKSIIKKRLHAWGAQHAENLKVLTREDAPDLRDTQAWRAFPVDAYDVLIIDSVGSATEGVTEKEGKETTLVLKTILDLARKGLAILLLQNTIKDGTTIKGRGEWSDRADIVYEVRDATGWTPSGKRPWWQELPEAGEAAWADRAARRKGRIDFRLAFVPSKFRVGVQPDPFCIELHLPADDPWTLRDVTSELQHAGSHSSVDIRGCGS